MPPVTPSILMWARKTAGLTLTDAAAKVGLDDSKDALGADRLADLEAGKGEPTRAQLRRMAKHYRRPLLVFYMDAIPRRGDRGEDFRTLPDDASAGDEALVDAALRSIWSRQALLKAALEDEDEAEPLSFVGQSRQADGVPALVQRLEQVLRFNAYGFKSASSEAAAFKRLRAQVESTGVFVVLVGDLGSHHSAIDVDVFRGFALADPIAPFVVINSNDASVAWSFTLLHELTHVLLGASGISSGSSDRAIERFCNEVASSFLLSEADLLAAPIPVLPFDALVPAIRKFARARRVSRQMIAYRLYRAERINHATWLSLRQLFHLELLAERARQKEQRKDRDKPTKLDWYVIKRQRVGPSLLQTAERMMESGALTTSKAGRVLGVRPVQVRQLLSPSLAE